MFQERRYKSVPKQKEEFIHARLEIIQQKIASLRKKLQSGEMDDEEFDKAISRLVVANEVLSQRAKLRGMIDKKTQLPNSRWFDEEIRSRVSESRREGRGIGLFMADIDNFGNINKIIGQLSGDSVLREVARQIELNTRIEDFPARHGGEEFMIIVDTFDKDSLQEIGERIRSGVENGHYGLAGKQTISLGGTLLLPHEQVEDLIQRANDAMKVSKNKGKNQVTIF